MQVLLPSCSKALHTKLRVLSAAFLAVGDSQHLQLCLLLSPQDESLSVKRNHHSQTPTLLQELSGGSRPINISHLNIYF